MSIVIITPVHVDMAHSVGFGINFTSDDLFGGGGLNALQNAIFGHRMSRNPHRPLSKEDSWIPILFAKSTNKKIVDAFCDECGVDYCFSSYDNATMLLIACEQYCLPLIKLLLDAGANVTKKSKDGLYAFAYLCAQGDDSASFDSIVATMITQMKVANILDVPVNGRYLLTKIQNRKNCNANKLYNTSSKANDSKQTFLMIAIAQKNIITVDQLLDAGINVCMVDSTGYTALHYAAAFFKYHHNNNDLFTRIVRLCKSTEHNVIDLCTDKGETALYIACKQNVDAALILLEYGVNPHIQPPNKCILVALMYSYTRCTNTTPVASNDTHKIALFAQGQFCKLIKQLIEAGLDISEKDSDGETAVAVAMRVLNLDVVDYLVGMGASITTLPSDPCTLLHIAMVSGLDHLEKVQFLMDAGQDINYLSNQGYTLLDHVVLNRDKVWNSRILGDVRFLLNHGGIHCFNDALVQELSLKKFIKKQYDRTCGPGRYDNCIVDLLRHAARWYAKKGWRPQFHASFTRIFRLQLRTILILRKAVRILPNKQVLDAYPCAVLYLLPEEVMQYLFLFIQAPPNKGLWPECNDDEIERLPQKKIISMGLKICVEEGSFDTPFVFGRDGKGRKGRKGPPSFSFGIKP